MLHAITYDPQTGKTKEITTICATPAIEQEIFAKMPNAVKLDTIPLKQVLDNLSVDVTSKVLKGLPSGPLKF